MSVGSIDGTHGFGRNLWAKLRDGGVWGVPRSGLVYMKDEAEKRLVLIARMPAEETNLTPEQLKADQDWDHERITSMFAAIGIEVIEDTE